MKRTALNIISSTKAVVCKKRGVRLHYLRPNFIDVSRLINNTLQQPADFWNSQYHD